MALYCLASAGGSPGVTTTGMALALRWPSNVLLAECDPAGGRVLPGYLADRLEQHPPGQGLLALPTALTGTEAGRVRLEDFTTTLFGHGRARLLHGITDPRHAAHLEPFWPHLGALLHGAGVDVIADLGRIGGPQTPFGLARHADLVVMVMRPSLVQVNAARPRLAELFELANNRMRLCLIDSGPYSAAEVSKALFGLPVLAKLPHAPDDARVLSDGARPRVMFRTSLLLRMAGSLADRMRTAVTAPVHADSGGAR